MFSQNRKFQLSGIEGTVSFFLFCPLPFFFLSLFFRFLFLFQKLVAASLLNEERPRGGPTVFAPLASPPQGYLHREKRVVLSSTPPRFLRELSQVNYARRSIFFRQCTHFAMRAGGLVHFCGESGPGPQPSAAVHFCGNSGPGPEPLRDMLRLVCGGLVGRWVSGRKTKNRTFQGCGKNQFQKSLYTALL